MTYYTGMVDTVAHVPDRCYIADGYARRTTETRTWKMGDDAVGVRFINFEDATGFSSRVSKNVAYFFQVNGEMEAARLRCATACRTCSAPTCTTPRSN